MLKYTKGKETQLGVRILEVNGAGTKKRIVNFISKNGTPSVVVNNSTISSNCIIIKRNNNYNWSTAKADTADHSNFQTASAVVVAIDDLAESLGMIDTHYFPSFKYQECAGKKIKSLPKQHKVHRLKNTQAINRHFEMIYKSAIVQEVNNQMLMNELYPRCSRTVITPSDIAATLTHYINRYEHCLSDDELFKVIKDFIKKVDIQKDLQYVKDHYLPEQIDIWINGLENARRHYLLDDEEDKMTSEVRVYQYGRKQIGYKNIHSLDGEFYLKMPIQLRDKIQCWYNKDSKKCINVLKEKLKDVFVLKGEDAKGFESDWTSFKKQLSKRKNEELDIDISDVEKNIDSLLDFYKKFLQTDNGQDIKDYVNKNYLSMVC